MAERQTSSAPRHRQASPVRGHRGVVPWAALNAMIGLCAAVLCWWPAPSAASVAVNLLLLCVPGLAWLRLVGRAVVDRYAVVLLTLALSIAAGALAVGARILAGIQATPLGHVAALAALTNVGLLVTWGRPWPAGLQPLARFGRAGAGGCGGPTWPQNSRRGNRPGRSRPAAALPWRVLVPLGVAAYTGLFVGATAFVDPLEDQDIEVQGTAYAIVHRGTPLMLHDRRLPYHFAHPHLLHWLAAQGLLLTGQLDAVRPYYDAALEARAWLRGPLRPGEVYEVEGLTRDRITRESRWEPMSVHILAVEGDGVLLDRAIPVRETGTNALAETRTPTRGQFLDRILWRRYRKLVAETFEARPLLWQTRMLNLALAVAALFLLHEAAAALSGSRLVAVLVPLAYMSVPEVIGRSCSAAYLTVTVVFLLGSAWWYVGSARGLRPTWSWGVAFVAASLLALANHKAVVAVAGMVLAGALAWWLRRDWRGGLKSAITSPVAWGFAAGTALFWAYGLAIAPDAFILDHLRHHLLDRLGHVNALGYGGYPSAGTLWWRFVWDAGVALPLVGLAALAWLLARGASREGRVLAMVLWFVFVGVAFTLIDWRQTKHLMHLMPVLVLAPAAAAGRSGGAGRLVWPVLLLASAAGALARTAEWMARGFQSFTPAGGW